MERRAGDRLAVQAGLRLEAGEYRLASADPADRPCAGGQYRGVLDQETVRVYRAAEQGRLAADRGLRVVLTEMRYQYVADLAQLVDAAEHLVPPDLAGSRREGLLPGHGLAGTDVDDVVPGVRLRKCLRAEHLHGLPEPYDTCWVIRHDTRIRCVIDWHI